MERALHLWDPMPSLVDAVRIDRVTGHAVGARLGSLLGLFVSGEAGSGGGSQVAWDVFLLDL